MTGSRDPQDGDELVIQPLEYRPSVSATRQRPAWLRPASLGIAALLLIALAATWFVFTGIPVQVTTEPPAERIDISGGPVLELAGRQLLRPGSYLVEAELDGHHPLQTSIEVSRDGPRRWQFELRKLPGRLQVTSTPPGADVLVDGGFLGSTPLSDAAVEAGPHELTIQLARHRPWQGQLDVTGMDVSQDLDVTLEPAWADVVLATEPPGASVTLEDGSLLGTTPMDAEILEGQRRLDFKLAGHKIASRELELRAGERVELPLVRLEPADGLLQVTTRPEAVSVTIDGSFRGTTPLEVDLAPGRRYRVELFKPGYQRASRNVDIVSGREQQLAVDLAQETGELRVAVEPADARLVIDEIDRGPAEQVLQLSAEPHHVEIRKEGFAPFRTRITPRPGFPQEIVLRLKTVEEARLAAIEPVITTAVGIEMRLLFPTDFTMGTQRREPGARANEVQRQVRMTRPFYLATTETTNAQYRRFARTHDSGSFADESLDDGNQPVVSVSWNQAALFCNWLSREDGLTEAYIVENGEISGFDPSSTGYRLPTEAEWAWAARVLEDGSMLRFPWGDDRYPPENRLGNFADRSVSYVLSRHLPAYEDGYTVTAPVANFDANRHGLYDLGGNVSEWINDFYSADIQALGAGITDPLGPPPSRYHVIRGASWRDGQTTDLRMAFRDFDNEGRDDLGFRIARYLE